MANDGSVRISTEIDNAPFEQGLKETEKKLKDGEKKLVSGAKKIAAGIGLALGAAGAAALKFGSEFEQSIANASTLFGGVAVDTDNLKRQILDLSDASGVAATEIGDGLYQALSAGVPITEDAADAVEFMRKSTQLAKAGFTDTNTAVTATAKVMNAYGLGLEDVDQIQGVLIQTQNLGITTVGELGNVLSNVTGTAANLGLEFSQVASAIAVMTARGQQTGVATTSLNALLVELSKSGSKADIALRRASQGLQVYSKEAIRATSTNFAKEEKALSKSLSKQLKLRKDNIKEERKLMEDKFDTEIELLEKNADEELDLAQETFDKKKELINQEFLEKLKLIDEERYNRLKAIDDEIKGIEDTTRQEEEAIKAKEEQEKRNELNKRIAEAKTIEERKAAVEQLNEFELELQRESILAARDEQIKSLEARKDNINEELDARVDAIKAEKVERDKNNKSEFDAAKAVIESTLDEQKSALEDLHEAKLEEFDKARDAELERIQESNEARVDAFRESNAAIVASMSEASGEGFADLLASGMDLVDILKLLEEQAEASGVPVESFFGSVEAQKALFALMAEDGKAFDETLGQMTDTTGKVQEGFDKVNETIANRFNKNMNELKNVLIGAFEDFKGVVNVLFDFYDGLKKGEDGAILIATAIGTLTTLVIAYKVQQALATAGLTAWEAISAIGAATTTALGAAFTFLTSPIGLVILAVGALVAATILIVKHWEEVKEFLIEVWNAIVEIATELWNGFTEWFTELWNKIKTGVTMVWESIKTYFKDTFAGIAASIFEVWNGIKDFFSGLWESIAEIFTGAWDGIKDLFNGIVDFVTNVFTNAWSSAWRGISDVFRNIFEGLKEIAKAPINWIIDKLNGFIEGINKIKIPDWVPSIGGKGINIPVIPKLAKGGLAFGDTLAMVGDNPNASTNPEVIAPLDKLQDIMYNGMPMGGSGMQKIVVISKAQLEIDGSVVADTVAKHQDDIYSFR